LYRRYGRIGVRGCDEHDEQEEVGLVTLATFIEALVGRDVPIGLRGYDGTRLGPPDPPATIVVKSPDAVARIVQAPGELGFARAYVAGDIDIEGDIFAALQLRDTLPDVKLTPQQWVEAARLVGGSALRRLPPPPEEARLHGRRHTRTRDRAAVSYHYDMSNDFYRLVLGPSMTYSCGVWTDASIGLDQAQANKYDLICRKLDLEPGQRLLDVGCGWGGMLMHAAGRYGVDAVGVTVSAHQHEGAAKAIAEVGLGSSVQVRLQDYRDVSDRPYDAVSSIGMFEHVGLVRLREYFDRLYWLLKPGGRLLNHGISRQPPPNAVERRSWPTPLPKVTTIGRRGTGARTGFKRGSFIDRYVFPDGELHEVGAVISVMQDAGFEVRHVESLREHYGLTLRAWVANLEANWDAAVQAAGPARTRVWRLYMAASALNFETGRTAIHQVLAVKHEGGRSGLPLRPSF
jgi:cyclopropane-fatty-acyl-phospholipid synthase